MNNNILLLLSIIISSCGNNALGINLEKIAFSDDVIAGWKSFKTKPSDADADEKNIPASGCCQRRMTPLKRVMASCEYTAYKRAVTNVAAALKRDKDGTSEELKSAIERFKAAQKKFKSSTHGTAWYKIPGNTLAPFARERKSFNTQWAFLKNRALCRVQKLQELVAADRGYKKTTAFKHKLEKIIIITEKIEEMICLQNPELYGIRYLDTILPWRKRAIEQKITALQTAITQQADAFLGIDGLDKQIQILWHERNNG
jgi:hypothetical protein